MARPFKDRHGVIHAVIGFVASSIRYISPIASAVISISYFTFQYLDEESITENISDYVEYICGFLIGLSLFP